MSVKLILFRNWMTTNRLIPWASWLDYVSVWFDFSIHILCYYNTCFLCECFIGVIGCISIHIDFQLHMYIVNCKIMSRINVHTRMHAHTHMHTNMHTHTDTHKHTRMHTCMYTHECTNTHMCTYCTWLTV